MKKNVFATYLEENEIDTDTVSKKLNISKAYVHLLMKDTTPSLKLAGQIEVWSKGAVKMQSWVGIKV